MDFMSGETVEAIEEGKIVRVSENYAKKEGLPIIRGSKQTPKFLPPREAENKFEKERVKSRRVLFDEYRKPLNWRDNQVVKELIDNFHWHIKKRRAELNLSRRQLADDIGESEETVKRLEYGLLPKDDFVLINKVQDRLKINLRKDKKDFNESFRAKIEEECVEEQTDLKKEEGGKEEISDIGIEILE